MISHQIRKWYGVLPRLFFNTFGQLRYTYFSKATSVPVLLYHQVAKDGLITRNQRSCISPQEFEDQMCFLHSNGYRTLSMSELLAWLESKIELPAKSICLTFDDGHRDNYTNAFPVLQKYDLTATIFICPFQVGRNMWYSRKRKRWERAFDDQDDLYFEFLSWEQIIEMANNGIHFGCHSLTHPYLTTLEEEDLSREIAESKRILEMKLGSEINFFAYPYGEFNQRVRKAVIDAGYRAAVCIGKKRLHINDDPFSIRRLGVNPGYDITSFKILLYGLVDLYEHIRSLLIPDGFLRRYR